LREGSTGLMRMTEFLFWLAAATVAYVYIGYPIVLIFLRGLRNRPVLRQPIEPRVSILVAAHNEAAVIEKKIRNTLALDYPHDRLELVIASDGSTDGTETIAERFADGEKVRLIAYPRNRGKLATLNETVPLLKGEIVAFSDASSMLAPDAIRNLVSSFADPEVGAVSGVYKVRNTDEAQLGRQEDLYWQYETFLKIQEAASGSILGAHGSLYAIRRALYSTPPPEMINDDYIIPLRVLQQGYRVAYEPRAIAYEEATDMGGFGRRIRIMTGNIEQLREIKGLLQPVQPLALFFFLSHKLGRLAVPPAMVVLIVCNLILLQIPFYFVLGCLQLAFYGLVIVGAAGRLIPRAIRLPYYFCMINAAALVGMYHVISGRRRMAWKS
jgi:cellulose synthase/poly-beta-1,6-N-acetylglucosamine synthase-like glycosyltransferase